MGIPMDERIDWRGTDTTVKFAGGIRLTLDDAVAALRAAQLGTFAARLDALRADRPSFAAARVAEDLRWREGPLAAAFCALLYELADDLRSQGK